MKHKPYIIINLILYFFVLGCKKEENLLGNELEVSGKNGEYIITSANGNWMIAISSNDNLLSINAIKPDTSSCTMIVRELQEKNSVTFHLKDDKQNKTIVIEDGEITQPRMDVEHQK